MTTFVTVARRATAKLAVLAVIAAGAAVTSPASHAATGKEIAPRAGTDGVDAPKLRPKKHAGPIPGRALRPGAES